MTAERLYELICEEQEHNPIVGTAFFETKEFLVSLGYSLRGAEAATLRVERTYDMNLFRRPTDNHHTDSGATVTREFGVTRSGNVRVYTKIMAFYGRLLKKGMSKEEAIKATHEHYDPILAKELTSADQTEQNTITIPKSISAAGRCKDLSDLEIEI